MKVKLEDIIIGTGRREVSPGKVQELASSIKEIGLLNPVTIGQDYTLIAGLHRLMACQELGFTEIECNMIDLTGLKAELAEIDENLIRNELHYIDRGEQLKRRKEIYEELYPETKKGAINQYTKVLSAESADSKNSFVNDTARKTGVSTRVIHEELQIAKNLTPEAKEIIKELDIPKTQALNVARLEPEEQSKIVETIEKHPEVKELPKKDIIQTVKKLEALPEEDKPKVLEKIQEITKTPAVNPEKDEQLKKAQEFKKNIDRLLDRLHLFSENPAATYFEGLDEIDIIFNHTSVFGELDLKVIDRAIQWLTEFRDEYKRRFIDRQASLRRVK